jgi:prepilin-type processing-associated H-X9-DG protein
MKSQTAFSKKELVVILVSVFFVLMNIGAINSAGRRRAKDIVCLSNLRHWGTIFEMFTNDNDGYLNEGLYTNESETWTTARPLHYTGPWMNALQPYYKTNRRLLTCPEATKISSSPGKFAAWSIEILTISGVAQNFVGSYGINSWTNNATMNIVHGQEQLYWKSVRGVEGRNTIPILLDSSRHNGWPNDADQPPSHDGDTGLGANDMNRFCINRHNGAVNCLFMDFSARKVGLKELWTLKWHRNFNTAGHWTKAGGVQPQHWPEWMREFKDY